MTSTPSPAEATKTFIENLAATGNVTVAARRAGLSRRQL